MPPAKTKAQAARAEKAETKQPKKFTFRGLKLEGPSELPGTLDFDLGDLQLQAESGEESDALVGMQRLLQSILGREQLLEIRKEIKGLDDPWQRDLLQATLAAYGTESGEASASAKS